MALLKIFVGTMYGGSLDVAEQVQPLFEQAGYTVEVLDQPTLEDLTETRPDLALFVTSTTGSGDVPGNLSGFLNALSAQSPALDWLRYGLIALGDSSYGETYCGAGRQLDEGLADLGATRHGERLEIDAMETFMADDAALPWVESWIPTLPATA